MDTVGPLARHRGPIAPDGEILMRGELVMHGYWRNDAETAKVLIDGWLHTGDIGHFDERGRMLITDRKKDMIVNDKGDNISPQKVEGMLTLQPEIAQAMVIGDRRPYVVGLIVPDAEWSLEWARRKGWRLIARRCRATRPSRGDPRGGGPGERRPVGDRKGAPVHLCRRAVQHRQ
jgi:long-chain acyl-CoA synthetase